ncbi:protein FAM185A [Trichomycterus rosablanca]|uniref:protein FAM185A n=1 Tax=Trichomycterus rosablanca TaxID=2290929 RepID=UPI002F356F14
MQLRLLYAVCGLKPVHEGSRRFALRAFRAFSDCAADSREPLKQWSLTVSPFIKISCHLHCNVSIRPLDPHAFPGSDRALISLHGHGGGKLDGFQVHYDDQRKELKVEADQDITDLSVELATPIKSDLHVVTKGKGSVKIQNMESDVCQIQTEKGDCVLQSVKSHIVKVHSSGGSITGVGTIHGEVDIVTAGDSSIDIKKIQGTSMNVCTEHGPLKVKAVYAESSVLDSSSGKIHVGHAHGETLVRSNTGDIVIDSSSGALTAFTNAGSINAYVSQTGRAELHTQQGAIHVRIPSTLKAWVQLCGTTVDSSSDVTQETEQQSAEGKTVLTGRLNGGTQEDCWIRATADRGAVSLNIQSWIETLKLKS